MLSILLKRPVYVQFQPAGATESRLTKAGKVLGAGNALEDAASNLGISEKSGVITLDASISESHDTTVEVTDYPVQSGVDYSDHVIIRPDKVRINGVISDSPLGLGFFGAVSGGLGSITSWIPGQVSRSAAAYKSIEELQKSRVPFTVVTGLKTYDNMILTNLSVPRDKWRSNAVYFSADLRQVTVGELLSAAIPAEAKTEAQSAAAAKAKGTSASSSGVPDSAKKAANTGTKAAKTVADNAGPAGSILHDVFGGLF